LIDIIFKEGKIYHHCLGCGGVYGLEWAVLMYKHNPSEPLPKELKQYEITTGVCPPCWEPLRQKYAEKHAIH
jgi:hypothetical protein